MNFEKEIKKLRDLTLYLEETTNFIFEYDERLKYKRISKNLIIKNTMFQALNCYLDSIKIIKETDHSLYEKLDIDFLDGLVSQEMIERNLSIQTLTFFIGYCTEEILEKTELEEIQFITSVIGFFNSFIFCLTSLNEFILM